MSFRRSFVTLLAVLTLASPVFAADAPTADSSAVSPASDVATQPTDMSSDANKSADQSDDSSAQDASDHSDTAKNADGSAADESNKVNVNTATAKELIKVKGISVYRARQLIAYRKKNGHLTSLDSLKQVKGFTKLSNDQLKKIQDQLTVE